MIIAAWSLWSDDPSAVQPWLSEAMMPTWVYWILSEIDLPNYLLYPSSFKVRHQNCYNGFFIIILLQQPSFARVVVHYWSVQIIEVPAKWGPDNQGRTVVLISACIALYKSMRHRRSEQVNIYNHITFLQKLFFISTWLLRSVIYPYSLWLSHILAIGLQEWLIIKI